MMFGGTVYREKRENKEGGRNRIKIYIGLLYQTFLQHEVKIPYNCLYNVICKELSFILSVN